MKSLKIGHFLVYALFGLVSCSPPDDNTQTSLYSCGVLSNKVESYSDKELILKIRYFIVDGNKSSELIEKNIENYLTLYSSDVVGTLIDNKEITTPLLGNYSCAVLLDEVYNNINYDFFSNYSSTDSFLRKFFKNAGMNNKILFSAYGYKAPSFVVKSDGFVSNSSALDIPLASYLNSANELTEKCSNTYLLKYLSSMLDLISQVPGTNRNLLLISSRTSYLGNSNGFTKDSVINKATRLGIKVSTILDKGGEYYIDYNLNEEDIYYKLAYQTGGFVYMDNEYSDNNSNLVLASRLGNIFEGNFKCFESTWRIVPKGIWTELFRPGFYADGNLEAEMGTQYLSNIIEFPFCIYIK
jgi:hypothetical protein